MSALFNIDGLDALNQALQDLPAKIEARVLRGGLRAGANEILAEAKALCPVSPPSAYNKKLYGARMGELRDSLRISTGVRNGKVSAKIKAGNKKAWYAHLVEFGSARHRIQPSTKKSLVLGGLFRSSIDHPGAKPSPFMRRAMDRKSGAALRTMAEYMRIRVPREIKKAGT